MRKESNNIYEYNTGREQQLRGSFFKINFLYGKAEINYPAFFSMLSLLVGWTYLYFLSCLLSQYSYKKCLFLFSKCCSLDNRLIMWSPYYNLCSGGYCNSSGLKNCQLIDRHSVIILISPPACLRQVQYILPYVP